MFGLIYTALCGVFGVIGSIKEIVDDSKSKGRTYDYEDNTYRNSKGWLIDDKSGYNVSFTRQPNGDRILKNYLHNYTRNIDQEKRDAEYLQLLANRPEGITVACWHKKYADLNSSEYQKVAKSGIAAGVYYHDLLKDGRVLVIRSFDMYEDENGKIWIDDIDPAFRKYEKRRKYYGHLEFYMDANTGELVRVADGEYEKKRNIFMKSKIDGYEYAQGDCGEYLGKLMNNVYIWKNKFNAKQKDKMGKFQKKKPYIDEADMKYFYTHYFYNYRRCMQIV
jgi:hypothetical protein